MIYSHTALMLLRVISMVSKAHMEQQKNEIKAKFGHSPGHFQIGVLFPIHRPQNIRVAGESPCGEIWEEYGIQRTQMALQTVDRINKDQSILPNLTLGVDIRDSCWTERIAMEQTIEFIRDALGQTKATDCCCGKSNNDPSCSQASKASNLAAVIGPGSSSVSIVVQNLLQVFRIPQIGYSATSKDLSNKEDYKYYMRVVPSDSWQARAMVDIVKEFGWTYIAVLYSPGNYGEKGFEELSARIKEEVGTCIAWHQMLSREGPEAYDKLIHTMSELKPRPQVALCFCEGDDMMQIFDSVKRHLEGKALLEKHDRARHASGADRYKREMDREKKFRFQWIGSESWGNRIDVVKGREAVAFGSLSLRIASPHVKDFDPYYFDLTPDRVDPKKNPWFREFWQQKFNCSLPNDTAKVAHGLQKCTGKENLTSFYEPDAKLGQVINSIYTVAHGLDRMYKMLCDEDKDWLKRKRESPSIQGLCPAMQPINGTLLFEMMNTTFPDMAGSDTSIFFDQYGDPPARYNILNYQGAELYKLVGNFTAEGGKIGINFDRSLLRWFDNTSAVNNTPVSICSEPCAIGQAKIKDTGNTCCWSCNNCSERQYLQDEECKACPLGFWPNDNRTNCTKLEVEYVRWSDAVAIVAMFLSCMGIVATTFTLVVFIKFNGTPVVKATTRELSYIILVGIYICYGMTFAIVAQPSTPTCYLVRSIPGISFAMIYGALLTKTNRIARILAGSKKKIMTKKPRFLSTASQVVITCLLVLLEIIIVGAALFWEPAIAAIDYSQRRRVVLLCTSSSSAFLAPFAWDALLISLCTLYAVKTRNLPENFNEAKFIGFTMYTTCIIWIAFFTIYFGSQNKAITMCLSFSLSATVALVLLFFPKLYIILLKPHKNARKEFTTTKIIRCHFGTTPTGTADSRNKSMPAGGGPSHSTTRPSSIASTDSSDHQRTRFRESVHIPRHASVPSSTTAAVAANNTNEHAMVEETSSCSSKHPLSVIEESICHEDSTPSKSRYTMSPNGDDTHYVRNVATQTGTELMQALIRSWSRPPSGKLKLDKKLTADIEHDSSDANRRSRRSAAELRRRQVSHDGGPPSPVWRHGSSTNSASPLIRAESSEDDAEMRKSVRNRTVSESSASDDGVTVVPSTRDSQQMLPNIFAQSFMTFFGTAVPMDETQPIYFTTEELPVEAESPVRKIKPRHIRDAVGATIETFLPPAVPDISTEIVDEPVDLCDLISPNTQKSPKVSLTNGSPPTKGSRAFDRKGSFIKRLGYSIKKRMRAKKSDPTSLSPRGSEAGSSVDGLSPEQHRRSSPLAGSIPEEDIAPLGPLKTSLHKRVTSLESDGADSGVVAGTNGSRMDKTVSFDRSSGSQFDTDSSKHSSAKSKPGSSLKRRPVLVESTATANAVELASPTDEQFQQLFFSQGLEAVELTQATLL